MENNTQHKIADLIDYMELLEFKSEKTNEQIIKAAQTNDHRK